MKSPFRDKDNNSLTWSKALPKITLRLYNYWLDLKIAMLWFLGYIPFHFIRRFLFSCAGIKMGPKSTIHIGARFYNPAGVSIGEGTIIGDHATLDGRAPLIIGNHVDIASQVMLLNSEHDINDPAFKPIEEPVTIEDYVFIGPRSIILPGITIGKGAVIGAGAVVTKNVAPFTVVGGVPAKIIGERTLKNPNYKLGRFRLFQ